MAVRMSLLRSALQKEEREQIGDMLSPLAHSLKSAWASCLLTLSSAARDAGQGQIAMNSIVHARELSSKTPSISSTITLDVSEEFSQVLWLRKEPKLAVQFLRRMLQNGTDLTASANDMRTASALARLVSSAWANLYSVTLTANLGQMDFRSEFGEIYEH